MLKLTDITLRRGLKVLFQNLDLTIHDGQRVGVTGANGTGKSSLFALLLGKLEADEGVLDISSKLVFSSTDQEVESSDRVAREYVIDGDAALREVEQGLVLAQSNNNGHRHAELLSQYEHIDGYTAQTRAATLLHGLGFSNTDQLRPVNDFSGGWRMRLNLARALMCPSDVLLLDEPTNHLDLDAVLWLESWLLRYSGTLLLISHDREFLDRIATHVAHIEQQKLRLYTGNYSDFEKQRAEQLALQQVNYNRQQREIAHIQSFIKRFKAKASKAKQAQSRVKALQRMELISAAHVDSEFSFCFRQPDHLPNPLLSMENATCGYGDSCIIKSANIGIQSGDKIGLLGMNGAGKSTFVRSLVGELPLISGVVKTSQHLKLGYFAQHQLEQLPVGDIVLHYLQRLDPLAKESEMRDFAGSFGFRGDRIFDKIEILSGGEKARLVLAAIVYQKPNLLLLDEPTNHLDIEMRHALTLALQAFNGALVMVSHDRHLLRCTVDELWLVSGGSVSIFPSDLDAYTHWLREQRQNQPQINKSMAAKPNNSSAARRDKKRTEAQVRKKLQPLKQTADRCEKKLERIELKLLAIQEQLSDSCLYGSEQKDKLQALLTEQASIKSSQANIEIDWLHALEALEKASQILP